MLTAQPHFLNCGKNHFQKSKARRSINDQQILALNLDLIDL